MSDQRLRRSSAVRAVMTSGARGHSPTAVVHARRRDDGEPARWTVVAGRKVGSAVRRNRAKRRLRALLRAHELPAGVDLVAVARPEAVAAPSEQLAADVAHALRQAVGQSVGADR